MNPTPTFSCAHCSRTFRSPQAAEQHERDMHGAGSERPEDEAEHAVAMEVFALQCAARRLKEMADSGCADLVRAEAAELAQVRAALSEICQVVG